MKIITNDLLQHRVRNNSFFDILGAFEALRPPLGATESNTPTEVGLSQGSQRSILIHFDFEIGPKANIWFLVDNVKKDELTPNWWITWEGGTVLDRIILFTEYLHILVGYTDAEIYMVRFKARQQFMKSTAKKNLVDVTV